MSASKTKPSHAYSSISVAIVMFLLGAFVLILLHSHNLTNIIKERMVIIAEMVNDGDTDAASEAISQIPEIRRESITLIPKAEAIETMGSNMNMDFSEENNPFRDVITFTVKASEYDSDVLAQIKEKLSADRNIQSVYYENLTIENIKSNLNRIAYVVLSIGLIFVFLAVVIIRNTINLSMYADRWEIKTMELIGAKWGFIKMPYIKTGVMVGFRAFIIASLFLMGLLILVNIYFPNVWEVVDFIYILIALAVIFVISIVIPAITTNMAANKYLKKHMDAMYD